MGKIGQVVSGSVAAASLAGTVYIGAETYTAIEEYQVVEAARADAAERQDIEEHSELSNKVMKDGATSVMTALGSLAFAGVTITSFWGIYETRTKKPLRSTFRRSKNIPIS